MESKTENRNGSGGTSNHKLQVIEPALPKGGGALQGIGETFQADEFTGTASLSIPFGATPCRGFAPEIAVSYSSGAGNGVFGQGFGVGLPSITRQTSKGIPTYTNTDTFLFSGADYLVLDSREAERAEELAGEPYRIVKYRPRVDGRFARIEYWKHATLAESFWKVLTADNMTLIFGKTLQARIADPENELRVFEWLLEESLDAHGNQAYYVYRAEDEANISNTLATQNRDKSTNRYISCIKYGNVQPLEQSMLLHPSNENPIWHFEVVFDYGEYNAAPENSNPYQPTGQWHCRPDAFSRYHAGFEIRTHRLCQSILMIHHFPAELGEKPVLVHALRFKYDLSPALTRLHYVEKVGYRFEDGKYTFKAMPPLEFDYTTFEPQGYQYETFKESNDAQLPGVSQGGLFSLTDLYGEGIPGILYADGQSVFYWPPSGAASESESAGSGKNIHFEARKLVHEFPVHHQISGAAHTLMDFTGDGRMDLLVNLAGQMGYYALNSQGKWQGYKALNSFPISYTDSFNQHVDVTGDGLSDIIRIENDRVVVYPAVRAKGYQSAIAQPRKHDLPTTGHDSAQEIVHFADILGAGTPQLVKIVNGLVSCWPSLGYGRFGKKITLENSPHFGVYFDASRLKMVDIDGSGTADLVYIESDHIRVFFNQCGNRFSDPISIPLPQKWDNLSQIYFADVHGNGTQCLIFTKVLPKSQHWYYDFNQRQKPYLLKSITNNMGTKTRLHYRSSTHYYLKDKKENKPWITSLPFPVQVVSQIEHLDFVSGSQHCETYQYHHGHYDPVEREFRGFGRVDRQDAESFDEQLHFDVEGGESLQLLAEKYHLPPVQIKTWYHTGAWYPSGEMRDQYQKEFFKGDRNAKVFPNDGFEWGTENADLFCEQEARRALKGMMIRQETYGLDKSKWADNPYTVTERQYHVKLLQKRGRNRYGVFFVHSPESIFYQYERNPEDPLVSQDFLLELDAYGHPLKSSQVVYPRRIGQVEQQKKMRVMYQVNSYIHLDQTATHYLLGVPLEDKSVEVKGLLVNDSGYFSFESLKYQIEEHLPQATLLNWQRHYYYDPVNQKRMELGAVTPQALHCQTEVAAFEINALRKTFEGVLDADNLKRLLIGKEPNQGGYIAHQSGDASPYYWNAGGLQHYLKAADFYQPHAFIDPFGHETTYQYDSYRMLVKGVTDPLGNVVEITKVDYQTMMAEQLKDANGNTNEVRLNPLGSVGVMAHYGAEGEKAVGFKKLSEYSRRQEPESFEQVLQNPNHYLQGAAHFFYTDFFAWSGKIVPQHFESLNIDIPLLFQSLIKEGYMGSSGGLCSRFKDLETCNEFRLPPVFENQRAAIFDIIKKRKKEVPVHVFSCIAEKYPADQPTDKDVHCTISYFDGFGRELQSKLQVHEAQTASVMTENGIEERSVSEAWLTSGAIRYNNKGKAVKQYEPFYADSPHYLFNNVYNTVGAASEVYYDPLGRVIMTKTTKGRKGDEILHLFSKVVRGEFKPEFTPSIWTGWHYDANDTLKDSEYYQAIFDENGNLRPDSPVKDEHELNSLRKATLFYDTPEKHMVDNLGNTIEHQQCLCSLSQTSATRLTTYTEFDILGNTLSMTDPRLHADGKTNLEITYSLANEALKTVSVDAGTHWKLTNAVGNLIFSKDSKNVEVRNHYDELQRLAAIHVAGQNLDQTVQVFLYGDSHYTDGSTKKPFFNQPEKWNARGKLVTHFDEAGLNISAHHAFTGQPLASAQILNKDYKNEANWLIANQENKIALAQAISTIQKPEDLKNIQIPAGLTSVLENAIYTVHGTYDALGRAVTTTDPDGNITKPHYYSTGLLKKVEMAGKPFQDAPSLTKITYNAKGQRQSVLYGNGVQSKYSYNDLTDELMRIHTQGPDPVKEGMRTLQDLNYYYDAVSNVSHITDKAIQTVFCNNQAVKGEADYTYDSLYRLVKATGREHPALWKVDQQQQKEHDYFNTISKCINDANKIQNYTETFVYDIGGNLTQIKHQAAHPQGCWVRNHTLNSGSNRLDKSVLGACDQNPTDTHHYAYDGNGNQTKLDNMAALGWNYRDNVQQVTLIQRSNSPSDQEFYVYNGTGKRVRKVTARYGNGGTSCTLNETIYLGGFEIHRKKKGKPGEEQLISEWHTVRFEPAAAQWRYWISGEIPAETQKSQVRYQLENHLNSSTLELDRKAQLLSYEEYYPYGGTAIMAGKNQTEFKQKQYRYSGKEKDAATGLYYYGMRYYCTWLGRWLSADPAGTIDGLNLYAFVGGNPVSHVDIGGMMKAIKKTFKKLINIKKAPYHLLLGEGKAEKQEFGAMDYKIKKGPSFFNSIEDSTVIPYNYELDKMDAQTLDSDAWKSELKKNELMTNEKLEGIIWNFPRSATKNKVDDQDLIKKSLESFKRLTESEPNKIYLSKKVKYFISTTTKHPSLLPEKISEIAESIDLNVSIKKPYPNSKGVRRTYSNIGEDYQDIKHEVIRTLEITNERYAAGGKGNKSSKIEEPIDRETTNIGMQKIVFDKGGNTFKKN